MGKAKTTVIIGAGLSGLTTAYALKQAGRDVVVLERTTGVGGLARSLDLGGCIFDLGPHYFFLGFDARADRLVKECLGDEALVFDFRVSAIIRGRNIAWPPDLKALRYLPLSSTLCFIKNAIKRRFPPDRDCRGFIRAFYGDAIYQAFVGPYLEKKVPILGPDALDREWWLPVGRNIHNQYRDAGSDLVKRIEGRKRVPIHVRARVFFRLCWGLWKTARGRNLRKVLYPRGGMGRLAQGLAAKFEEAGGEIVLEADDVRLHRSGGRIAAVTFKGRTIADPQTVIWTGSIHALKEQLGLPRSNLPFLNIVLGFLTINRPLRLPPYLYTYYADRSVVFNRAYFPSIISRALVPEGKDAICVEISPPGPWEEASLKEDVLDGLEKVSLCRREDVEAFDLIEIREAYPVYPLDYYDTLKTVWEQLAPLENLKSIGRSGQFYYNNMARSLAMGLDLAEHLLNGDR